MHPSLCRTAPHRETMTYPPAVLAIRRRRRRRAADTLPVRLRHRRVRLARFVLSARPTLKPPRSPPATRLRDERSRGPRGLGVWRVGAAVGPRAAVSLPAAKAPRATKRIGNAEIHHHVTPFAVFATAGRSRAGLLLAAASSAPRTNSSRSRSRRNRVNSCASCCWLPAKEGTRVHTARSSW